MAFREKIELIFDIDGGNAVGSLKSLKSSVNDADGAFGKFKAGAGGSMDLVKQNAGAMALAGGTALAAFAITAVHAFTDTAKAAIDFGAATGLATEDASRWIAVGDDMGVSAEQLTTAFGKVGKSLDSGKWEQYGIATRDAGGEARATNDIILDSFDALGKIENETERARVGNELFGKGYANLAPMIGRTREEMEQYLSTVEGGQVITDAEAESAERMRLAEDALRDAIKDVTLAFGGMVAQMAPVIESGAKMVGWVSDLNTKMAEAPEPVRLFAAAFETLLVPVTGFQKVQAAVKREVDLTTLSLEDALAMTEDFGWTVEQTTSFTNAWREANGMAKLAVDDLGLVVEKVATGPLPKFSLYAMEAQVALDRAAASTKMFDDAVKALYGKLDEKDAWASFDAAMWNFHSVTGRNEADTDDYIRKLADMTSALKNVPPETKATIIAALEEGNVAEAERLLNQIARPRDVRFTAIGGGIGGAFNGFRAAGGPVSAGGTYLVGERGPELLHMGSSSGRVSPNSSLGGTTVNVYVGGSVMSERDLTRSLYDAIIDGQRRGELVGAV